MSELAGTRRSPWVRLVLWVGQVAERLSRRLHLGSGGVIGGRVIHIMAPRIFATLAAGAEVSLVSGTNGKTTTTAYLAAALGVRGPVATNSDGANTQAGLLHAVAAARSRRIVLETDEGWLPWALEQLGPAEVVLTNLSRDQLHRHHEVQLIADRWRTALSGVGHVVANADDPAIVYAALVASSQTWVAAGARWTEDHNVCPRCRHAVHRAGSDWRCSECDLARPRPDWWLEGQELVGAGVRFVLHLTLPGEANLANAAMAVAAAARQGIDPQEAAAQLSGISSVAGRYDVVEHCGRQARMLLAKNPASWFEALGLLAGSTAPVVLAFNSDGVDGSDPSWLYDVSFCDLAGRLVVVTGRRATDLLVRLEIDGLQDVRRAATVTAALELLPPGEVDVVANYTAFQEARRKLAGHGH